MRERILILFIYFRGASRTSFAETEVFGDDGDVLNKDARFLGELTIKDHPDGVIIWGGYVKRLEVGKALCDF